MLSKYRIVTWNMQGGEGSVGAGNKLFFLITKSDFEKMNIFCLQEIGSPTTTSFLTVMNERYDIKKLPSSLLTLSSSSMSSSSTSPSTSSTQTIDLSNVYYDKALEYLYFCKYANRYYLAAIQQDFTVKSTGKRCSTAILIDYHPGYQYYFDINDVTSGKRPSVCVRINNELMVSSVHCIANDRESVDELKGLVSKIHAKDLKYIIGGDFNQTPERALLLNEGAVISNRKYSYNYRAAAEDSPYLVYGDNPTQGGGGIRKTRIDYFIVSKDLYKEDLKPMQIRTTMIDGTQFSDHDLLYLDVEIESIAMERDEK